MRLNQINKTDHRFIVMAVFDGWLRELRYNVLDSQNMKNEGGTYSTLHFDNHR